MSTTKTPAPDSADERKRASNAIAARVGEKILLTLGRPSDLFEIQVKRLWDLAYRVNVFVGSSFHATIQHSYFVQTTDAGDIVTAQPPVIRVY